MLVPPPGSCTNYWIKSASTRYFIFDWDNITIPSGDTKDDYNYLLSYYVAGEIQQVLLSLDATYKLVYDFDYSIGVDTVAGTIQTVYYGYTNERYSIPVDCISVTQSPTENPTDRPSQTPIFEPSMSPTQSPTFTDPYLYIGGDICAYDRCDCYGFALACVGNDVYSSWPYV